MITYHKIYELYKPLTKLITNLNWRMVNRPYY